MKVNRKRLSRLPLQQKILILLGILLLAGLSQWSRSYFASSNTLLESTPQSTIKCVDGDTFWLDGQKIRMLAIDTPESTTTKEAYGKQASDYTCSALKQAKVIRLEQDKGNTVDKYDRTLAWVFVDGQLLQTAILREGLGEVKYVDKATVNTAYLSECQSAQQDAQSKKLNLWSQD